MRQIIIFRADANVQTGLGHISRCLALAELLKDDYDVRFATRQTVPTILALIQKTTDKILLLPDGGGNDEIERFSHHLTGNEIVVLDGYDFTTEYEAQIKKRSKAVLAIDDIPNRHFVADVVVNFCGDINAEHYDKEYYTQVYSGLEYLFLRNPFLRETRNKKQNDSLFINMGGTDPHGTTPEILSSVLLSGFKGSIDVVVGSQFQHQEQLGAIARQHGDCQIHTGITSSEMFEIMSRCCLAIVPPSTVALEFLSTGGLVFLRKTAENQRLLHNYLINLKIAADFSSFQEVVMSTDLPFSFEEHLSRQKMMINSESLKRITQLFSSLVSATRFTFRKAALSDMRLCFEWANDEAVRRYSFSSEKIPWEKHLSWFQAKISEDTSHYFIVLLDDIAVGQVRFDFVGDGIFQISYNLGSQWRGQGLSTLLLLKAIKELRTLVQTNTVIGYVQKNNLASMKAFKRANFEMMSTTKYPNSVLFQLRLD